MGLWEAWHSKTIRNERRALRGRAERWLSQNSTCIFAACRDSEARMNQRLPTTV